LYFKLSDIVGSHPMRAETMPISNYVKAWNVEA